MSQKFPTQRSACLGPMTLYTKQIIWYYSGFILKTVNLKNILNLKLQVFSIASGDKLFNGLLSIGYLSTVIIKKDWVEKTCCVERV